MTYRTIDSIFQNIDETLCAAEAHGMAAGMLCIDNRTENTVWLNEVTQESDKILEEERSMLVSLFEKTRELLVSDDSFEFDLFLPEEECPLQERAVALTSWCQGFLYGVGYASSTADWPGEAGEILKDIMEFSRLDTEVVGEDDENALMEINEYLRAAVLLITEELNDGGDEKVLH